MKKVIILIGFLGLLVWIGRTQTNYTGSTIGTSFNGTHLGNGDAITSIRYRAGVTNIGNLATSVAVTFASAFPTTTGTNYYVAISFDQNIASAVSAAATSKTTNGFTISLSAGITGNTTVDYMAIPYQ